MWTPLLYVPRYQERFKPWNPWFDISQVTDEKWIDFKKIILPWDTSDSDAESKFSLHHSKTRISENIIKIFRCVDNGTIPSSDWNITFWVYSLLGYPSMNALLEIPQELQSRISKISMIHPALNPILSVSIMDWLVNKSLEIPQDPQHYLDWVPEEKFWKIIWKWRGDWLQFQRDLQRFLDSNNQTSQRLLDVFSNRVYQISNTNDKIAYWFNSVEKPCRKNALKSHKPNLTWQQISTILNSWVDK